MNLDRLGITALNPMQDASLAAHRQDRDVVLLAPTGSGKTLAFLLPLAEGLVAGERGVQALVLAPSRELAGQIEEVFRKLGTPFKVDCFYGGHPFASETNSLREPPAVLIGTPGRVADHLRRGTFDPAPVRRLVLDEFDKSLELGFQNEMTFIVGQLSGLRRRTLTSATRMAEIPAFVGLAKAVTLDFLSDTLPAGLTLKKVVAEGNDKLEALFRLLCRIGGEATLVFCNHREAVERISELLAGNGLVHDVYHGGLEQEDRERALVKLRNGSSHILLTTDLASRGLDVPQVRHVVHYQLPHTEEAFVHRNGRTARMHAEGTAYLMLAETESLPSYLHADPETVAVPELGALPNPPAWATLYFGGGKKEKISKADIVGLLLKKGGLQSDEVGRIEVGDHAGFAAVKRSKARKVVELLRNEKIKQRRVKIEVSR
jgi:ATP-independent RNA helicase DbpA